MSKKEIQFSTLSGSNPCLETCSVSSCCKNMLIEFLTPKQLKLLTPPGTHVTRCESKQEVPEPDEFIYMKKGVCYSASHEPGYYFAAMIGPCSNLSETSECTIYEKRPSQCKKFEPGSKECNSARSRDNLPTLKILD